MIYDVVAYLLIFMNHLHSCLMYFISFISLKIYPNKLVEPSTSVLCLGIVINNEDRTMSIPPDKLQERVKSCDGWQQKEYVQKDSSSLCLDHLCTCKCAKPVRLFLNRMLIFLRDNVKNKTIFLSQDFSKI